MSAIAPAACALCDAADPLGIGLCPPCLSSRDTNRMLIFLTRDARAAVTSGDEALGGLLPSSDGGAALRSGRPLLGVPATAAPHVLRAFASRELAARALPSARAWRALPSHFFAMLACILGAGALAGAVAQPSFLWLSPLLAAGLLFLAHRSMQRPLLAPVPGPAWPPALHAGITGTLLALPAGKARDRLVDLVRIARPLTTRLAEHGDPAGIRDAVHDLLAAACDTAREADRLSRGADVIRSSLVWTSEVAGPDRARSARVTLRRCIDAANLGMTRLAEAVSAVGGIDAQTAGLDGPVGSGLADVTRGLEAAARIHADTSRELEGLLA